MIVHHCTLNEREENYNIIFFLSTKSGSLGNQPNSDDRIFIACEVIREDEITKNRVIYFRFRDIIAILLNIFTISKTFLILL